jgi:hypothetical protein
MAVRVSSLRSGRALTTGRFLVLISVISWVNPWGRRRLRGLGKLKKTKDVIGNRTSDLPSSSIPQPTIIQCAPSMILKGQNYFDYFNALKRSQSYITTDSQSWCQATSGTRNQFVNKNFCRQLQLCWCWAPTLARGWVCNLECNDANPSKHLNNI